MEGDVAIGSSDFIYGDDFLEEFTKDYKWSSLLDAADASPSQILADAVPILVPTISPISSVNSWPTESSNSDSSSEDDSKNSGANSARQSSLSPIEWLPPYEDESSNTLKLEDIELFLQKTDPLAKPESIQCEDVLQPKPQYGPVMAIENGVIKGVKSDNKCLHTQQNGNILINNLQNSYYNVVNENNINTGSNPIVLNNDKIHKFTVEPKRIPSILKRSSNLQLKTKQRTVVIPAQSTKDGKIAISPLPLNSCVKNSQRSVSQNKISPLTKSLVFSPNEIITPNSTNATTNVVAPVLDIKASESPSALDIVVSKLSEAEIKAIKKQQRMIKNRESACQSRQNKKNYVSALEHQLLEAHQEIARLKLENRLLRDQLDTNGRGRKIPRLDASMLMPKKNIAVIFAMVFMVSMNWNVLGWNSKPFVGPPAPHQSTRHLLWSSDDIKISTDSDQVENYGVDCQNITTETDFRNFNHTESIRIAGDLNRWIGNGKTLNWTYDVPRKKRRADFKEEKIDGNFLESYKLFNKLSEDSNFIDFISTKHQVKNIREKTRYRRLRKNRDIDFDDDNVVIDYERLYHKRRKRPATEFRMEDLSEWTNLLQALHRRDDTYYVVGVGKGEHLLLPAVSHNVTRPPRMALILPARTSNESLLADHVTLMQIDCSVVNTTLVKLKSDALPESLRKKSDTKQAVKVPVSNRKTSNSIRRSGMHAIDEGLPDDLHNSSNILNYPEKLKKQGASRNNEIQKDDLLTQYLVSKIDDSKQVVNDSSQYVGKTKLNQT